jgi:lysyl-tRNA synthetase, class II
VTADELVEQRRRKLAALRDEGVEPFPHAYPGVEPIEVVKAPFDELPAGEETEVRARVAGRLAARRGQGKAAFLDLADRSGRIQLHARADVLGQESLDRLVSLDLGDLLGAEGTIFRTRRGELSLAVDDWTLLAKSLRPPPEKHHGLTDVETRFRQRELDLMANEETREVFMTRARVITEIRRFLDAEGFVEVETPILQPIYGGGMGRPFTTHHNELDRTLYMRIATELYLKRLIVGGLERVYEIGKDFRNEGTSYKHQPEFTMLEWYEAYADYRDTMARMEELIATVAQEVNGTTKTTFRGHEVDLASWRRLKLVDALEEQGLWTRDADELRSRLGERDVDTRNDKTWAQLVDHALERFVEP